MKQELPLPEEPGYEQAYQQAYRLASEKLATLDIEQQCHRSDSRCQKTGSRQIITLDYINLPCQIILPDADVQPAAEQDPLGIKDKILILHYFNRARGTPLSHRLVAYKELPEGNVYYPTFAKRTIKPIVDNFGGEPERLIDIARSLGSLKANHGDAAITINAFSRVPITWILWRGDDEFPPDGNVLFDSTVFDYLNTEDIHILCENIAWKLVRQLRAVGSSYE